MRWLSRIAYWLRFRRHQSELHEELALHRDLMVRDFEARGMSSRDALDAANRAMGNATYMREEARSVWLPPQLEQLLQDVRYAWRGLRRTPVFTLVATLSLVLGIGANTAIFSLIDGLLLAKLPVPAASELIEPQRVVGARGTDQRFSRAEFQALTGGPVPLSMFTSGGVTLEVDGVASNGGVDAVDDRYFDLVGVRAQRGRVLTTSDEAAASPVAVVTDRFWRAHLNADPAALGRTIKLAGQPFTIVGVTPSHFGGLRFPAMTDVTIPLRSALALGIIREATPNAPIVQIVGRRPAAWSLSRAESELAARWNRCCAQGDLIRQPRGQIMAPATLSAIDVSRGIPQPKIDLRGRFTRVLMALMGAVAILLLAACVNVGSLLLARSSARSHELAVRVALGASRARILRQLLIESLELSLLGATGGLLLAWWGTNLLARNQLGDMAGIASPRPNGTVLAFTVTVSIVAGIVFGMIPALRIIRGDLTTPIRQSGRRSTRHSRAVLDRGLVALQIALALLLVSGAALLVQTVRNLREAELGFDPSARLMFTIDTRRTPYSRQGMTAQMAAEMLQAVRALPGVRSAGFGSQAPIFGGRSSSDNVTIPGGVGESSDFAGVTPGYFDALGIKVRDGGDVPAPISGNVPQQRDVVVNEAFVRKHFAGRTALGRIFRDAGDGDTTSTTDRIVGVVSDVKFVNPRLAPNAMYFVQVQDGDWPFLVLVVHAANGDRDGNVGRSIVRTTSAMAPGITVNGPMALASAIDDSLIREQIAAGLAAVFGAIALLLVAVGVYGVMLYQVAQRTNEIGIRMALGAQRRSVLALVLRQSLTIVAAGVVAGLPLALLAGRAVASQLYGVSPYSLAALLVAALTLVCVAIAASLVPAYRAVSVDPLVSLRTG